MSETCNRRQKCEKTRYLEREKCIFHCDKLNFDANDIQQFWHQLRDEYNISGVYGINQDKVFEGISFPKFQNAHRYPFNFFSNNNRLERIFTFKKCVFFDDVDFTNVQINRNIIFEECVFYGDLKTNTANEIEIKNCEFKKEITALRCKNLNISNSKFINNVLFIVGKEVKLIQAVFRKKFEIRGSSILESRYVKLSLINQFLLII